MLQLLAVGAGGFVGAVLRHVISALVHRLASITGFPVGTLAVNLIGCAALGVVSELADSRGAFSPETRMFLAIGLLGGFTTFSTFANESFSMVRDGQLANALVNVSASLILGVAALWLGRVAAHAVWR